jgi:methylated-DNA-[protein]-cysteine S-methyltransferase
MTTSTDILRTACSAQTVIATPLGPLLLARTPSGLAGAWFEGQRHHPPQFDAPHVAGDPLLERVADQLERYFAGSLQAFDIPFDLQGTAFQRAVWRALLEIGAGTTKTYSDIAREIGQPVAVRAVGAAVGRNPVSILVPCHRVIGSDGSLTGYAGGIDRKVALLRLESVRLGPSVLRMRAVH